MHTKFSTFKTGLIEKKRIEKKTGFPIRKMSLNNV